MQISKIRLLKPFLAQRLTMPSVAKWHSIKLRLQTQDIFLHIARNPNDDWGFLFFFKLSTGNKLAALWFARYISRAVSVEVVDPEIFWSTQDTVATHGKLVASPYCTWLAVPVVPPCAFVCNNKHFGTGRVLPFCMLKYKRAGHCRPHTGILGKCQRKGTQFAWQ